RGLAAAAAMLLVAMALFWGNAAQATPAQAVRRALAAHREDDGHEYALVVSAGGMERETTLWTRGDRFRIEPGPAGGAWGQDGDGSVWLAPTPAAAALFRADEVPAVLQELLAVRSVRLTALLETVLEGCELERVAGPAGIDRIKATGEGTLRRAVLDIGKDGVVRSLELVRRVGPVEATVSLERRGPAGKDAAFYTARGAVAEDGEVFDRDRPGKRLALLARHRLGRNR
ncbi:MAG: hypothetical protein K2W96_11195, partial [Gemmataceae bacterium]|nr:hypothetical protein [Gemmataceae bacterium]